MKQFYSVLIVIMSVFIFSNCTKVEESDEKVNLEQNKLYLKVGEYHNEGMTFFLEKLRKEIDLVKNQDNVNREWLNKTVHKIYTEYSKSNKILAQNSLKSSEEGKYADMMIGYFNDRTNNTKSSSDLKLILDNSELNDIVKDYLFSIEKIIDKTNLNNTKEVIVQLNNVMLEAKEKLTSDEYEIIGLGGQVAISSILYSTENYKDWDDAFNLYGKNLKGSGPDYGEIGKADFTGAVGGAIAGSFAGGVGAVPGGLVGGLGASSGELLWQAGKALGEYFGWW